MKVAPPPTTLAEQAACTARLNEAIAEADVYESYMTDELADQGGTK